MIAKEDLDDIQDAIKVKVDQETFSIHYQLR